MSLLKLLKDGREFVRNVVLTTALAIPFYAGAEPAKIGVRENPWKHSAEIEMTSQSQTGGLASNLLREKSKKKANFYVAGEVSNGQLTLAYCTTDPENPSRDVPEVNLSDTRIFLYVPENTEVRMVGGETAVFKNEEKELNYRNLKAKDEASGLIMRVGRNLVDNIIKKDPSRAIVQKYSLGLLDFALVEEFYNSIDRRYSDRALTIKNDVGKMMKQSVDLVQVDLGVLDDLDVTRLKEVGRRVELKFRGAYEKIPVSVLIRLALDSDRTRSDSDKGIFEGYTEPILVDAEKKVVSDSGSSEKDAPSRKSAFDGVWILDREANMEEGNGYMLFNGFFKFVKLNPKWAYMQLKSDRADIVSTDSGREKKVMGIEKDKDSWLSKVSPERWEKEKDHWVSITLPGREEKIRARRYENYIQALSEENLKTPISY